MKFLFIGQGYPDVPGTGNGSGIGIYLYELTHGLAEKGHECHVIVWADEKPIPVLPFGDVEYCCSTDTSICDGKIKIYIVRHGYYRLLEKFFPDRYDENLLARIVYNLDKKYSFDWIEIEHEEGITIRAQRLFPQKTILRVHTTLAQMIDTKDVKMSRIVQYRLKREKKAIENASFITVPSSLHAREVKKLFSPRCPIKVTQSGRLLKTGHTAGEEKKEVPTFLVVGSADKRKGFDLLRGIMDQYARKYGACELRIVARCSEEKRREWKLIPPFPDGWKITWLENLSENDMEKEYASASVLLHPARYESFGLSLIEAAARETPIVCSHVGVAEDILAGELSKFIVEKDDPAEWADRVHEAMENKSAIGKVLRERYEGNYTREKIVEKFLECAQRQVELPITNY